MTTMVTIAMAAMGNVLPASAADRYRSIDLGTLGGTWSAPSAINERGQVVGTSETVSGVSHAYLWQDGVMIDLGTLGGDLSAAGAINNRGQVVGLADTESVDQHAFLWKPGRKHGGVMIDLEALCGGTHCYRCQRCQRSRGHHGNLLDFHG